MDREVTGKEVSWAKRRKGPSGNRDRNVRGSKSTQQGWEGGGMTLKTCWGASQGKDKGEGEDGEWGRMEEEEEKD